MEYNNNLFITEVYDLLLKNKKTIENYSDEFVRNWFNEIKTTCRDALTHPIYPIDSYGEIVSDMIWQYSFDEAFEKKSVTKELRKLAEKHDAIFPDMTLLRQ